LSVLKENRAAVAPTHHTSVRKYNLATSSNTWFIKGVKTCLFKQSSKLTKV